MDVSSRRDLTYVERLSCVTSANAEMTSTMVSSTANDGGGTGWGAAVFRKKRIGVRPQHDNESPYTNER